MKTLNNILLNEAGDDDDGVDDWDSNLEVIDQIGNASDALYDAFSDIDGDSIDDDVVTIIVEKTADIADAIEELLELCEDNDINIDYDADDIPSISEESSLEEADTKSYLSTIMSMGVIDRADLTSLTKDISKLSPSSKKALDTILSVLAE